MIWKMNPPSLHFPFLNAKILYSYICACLSVCQLRLEKRGLSRLLLKLDFLRSFFFITYIVRRTVCNDLEELIFYKGLYLLN